LAKSKTNNDTIEAVSLDEWVVKPVSLDDWNITEEKKPEPKIEAVSLDDWVVEAISIDDWNVAEDEPVVKKDIKIKPVVLVKNDLKEVINAKIAASESSDENQPEPLKLSDSDLTEKETPIALKNSDLKEEETESIKEDQAELLITPEKSDESEMEDSFTEMEIDFSEEEEISITEVIENEVTKEIEQSVDIVSEDHSERLNLEPVDLARGHVIDEKAVIRLTEDHLFINSKLDVLKLTEVNLSTCFEPVKRLDETDLFINSDETVLRLRSIDKKVNHRVVVELEKTFFIENEIALNENGAIILKHEDLLNQETEEDNLDAAEEDIADEAPKKSTRVKRAKREVKKGMSDAQIVRYSMYVIVVIIFLLPFTFHFKYSWETVSEERFEEASNESMDYFLKYRTNESWHRFYGRQLLDRNSYEKAAEENGFMTWLLYDNSKSLQRGDSYP